MYELKEPIKRSAIQISELHDSLKRKPSTHKMHYRYGMRFDSESLVKETCSLAVFFYTYISVPIPGVLSSSLCNIHLALSMKSG